MSYEFIWRYWKEKKVGMFTAPNLTTVLNKTINYTITMIMKNTALSLSLHHYSADDTKCLWCCSCCVGRQCYIGVWVDGCGCHLGVVCSFASATMIWIDYFPCNHHHFGLYAHTTAYLWIFQNHHIEIWVFEQTDHVAVGTCAVSLLCLSSQAVVEIILVPLETLCRVNIYQGLWCWRRTNVGNLLLFQGKKTNNMVFGQLLTQAETSGFWEWFHFERKVWLKTAPHPSSIFMVFLSL